MNFNHPTSDRVDVAKRVIRHNVKPIWEKILGYFIEAESSSKTYRDVR